MSRAILLTMMLFAVSLAGCFGGGEGPEDDERDDDGSFPWEGRPDRDNETDSSTRLLVSLTDVPVNGTFGQPLNVTWAVNVTSPSGDDNGTTQTNTTQGNATAGNTTQRNGTAVVNETGLVWDYVPDFSPRAITDYGNHSVAARNAMAPGTWNMTLFVNATEDDNGAGNTTVLYLRAYAIDENGTLHWSDEVEIELEPVRAAESVTVAITGSGLLAEYEPAEITIQVGDSVVWTNNDTLELTHTATSRDAPVAFDTGDIAPGAASEPIVFDTPGTYTYGCDNHPTMDEATIIVTEANEAT